MSVFSPSAGTYAHMATLGITKFPFSNEDLKTAFGDKIKKAHPDTGGSNAEASKVIRAKKALENLTIETLQDYDAPFTEKGEELKGKTKVCGSCRGTGKKTSPGFRECISCSGTGKKTLSCKFCDNGQFTQINKRKVPCKVCKGTGEWKTVKCNKCKSSGKEYIRDLNVVVCKCCRGKGKLKIKMFNPVIPEGAILVPKKGKEMSEGC